MIISKINHIMSDSALIWNVNKFYNDKAINEKKAEKLKKVDKILDEAKEMKEGLINN